MRRGTTKKAKHTKEYLARLEENDGLVPYEGRSKPETVAKLEHAFAMGATNAEAAFYAGISEPTLYSWFRANPKFKERCDQLKNTPTMLARKTVVDSLEKDLSSAWRWLEKKDPEFANKSQVTHTYEVKEISPVQAEIIKQADEQLLRESSPE